MTCCVEYSFQNVIPSALAHSAKDWSWMCMLISAVHLALCPAAKFGLYASSCKRLPVWIASLLHAAKHLKSSRARRKKVYRLLQRKMMYHSVGVKEGDQFTPTYVYPEEVKQLIRSVFSQDICDYPDPCHDQVVYLTLEDLHKVDIN